MTRHEMIELLGWHHQTMTDEQRDTLNRVEHIVKIAVLREREACAKVCDHMASRCNDIRTAALEVAAENIRARSQL